MANRGGHGECTPWNTQALRLCVVCHGHYSDHEATFPTVIDAG